MAEKTRTPSADTLKVRAYAKRLKLESAIERANFNHDKATKKHRARVAGLEKELSALTSPPATEQPAE